MGIEKIVSIVAGICAIATFFGVKELKKKFGIFLICIVAIIAVNLFNTGTGTSRPTDNPTTQEIMNGGETTIESITEEITYPTESQVSDAISITDINVVEKRFFNRDDAEEDIFGNLYDEYVWTVVGGLGAQNKIYEEYVTQGIYKRLTGTLFVDKDAPEKNSFKMNIYVNGKKKFTSPIIEKKTKPYSFDIDVSGAEFVKLEIVLVEGTASMESGWYKEARAFIANAEFSNE